MKIPILKEHFMKKVFFPAFAILAVALFASCANNSNSSSDSGSLFSSTALLPSEGFSFVPNTCVKQIVINDNEEYEFEWNETPVVKSGEEQETTCKTFSLYIMRRYYYSDENGICGYVYDGRYKFTLDWSAENWANRLALAAQKEKELAETDFKWWVGWVYNWGSVPTIIKNGSDYYLGWNNGSVNASAGVASGVKNRDPGVYKHDTKTFLGWSGLYYYAQDAPDSDSKGWNYSPTKYISEKPTLKDAATGTFAWTPYLCDTDVEKANILTVLFYNDGTSEWIDETKPKNGLYKAHKNNSSGKWSRNSDGQITGEDGGIFAVVDGTLWAFENSGKLTNEEGPANAELRAALDDYRDQERWYENVELP